VDSEIQIKTERLQKMLAAENLGGVLINSQHNFAWLTGGKSNGIDLSKENGACFLFISSDGKRYVLANNIEMPRLLTEEISTADFEPIEFSWQEEKSSGDFIYEKAKYLLNHNSEIASDLFLGGKVRLAENSIADCRYALTETEIQRYRYLGKDAGEAVGDLFKDINPGETELEIARKVKDALAAKNINSVVTIVAADERIEKYRHPVPTTKKWEKVLMVVVCAKRDGLIANLSRIACAGRIPDELQRKTEAVAYVFAKLLSKTKSGTSGAELYRIAAEAYAEKGYGDEIDLHHQGGATGYKTRDWVAHPASREIVRTNQAFAWNPSITGTKAEETAIGFENGAEIITASPDDGHEYLSPGILSL
jgi:antitoxin VapB